METSEVFKDNENYYYSVLSAKAKGNIREMQIRGILGFMGGVQHKRSRVNMKSSAIRGYGYDT